MFEVLHVIRSTIFPEHKPTTLYLGRPIQAPADEKWSQVANLPSSLTQLERQELVVADVNIFSGRDISEDLAILRDQLAEHLLILVESDNTHQAWFKENAFALGLWNLNIPEAHFSGDIYYFSLFDYKVTPDWFNSRFWANPENWEKYRW